MANIAKNTEKEEEKEEEEVNFGVGTMVHSMEPAREIISEHTRSSVPASCSCPFDCCQSLYVAHASPHHRVSMGRVKLPFVG